MTGAGKEPETKGCVLLETEEKLTQGGKNDPEKGEGSSGTHPNF